MGDQNYEFTVETASAAHKTKSLGWGYFWTVADFKPKRQAMSLNQPLGRGKPHRANRHWRVIDSKVSGL